MVELPVSASTMRLPATSTGDARQSSAAYGDAESDGNSMTISVQVAP